MQGLPRLCGLLCGNHGIFPGAAQTLFALQCVILVSHKNSAFVPVIPAPALAGGVPLPSFSMLAAASSAVVASVSLLVVASRTAPSLPVGFTHRIQPRDWLYNFIAA